MTTRKKSTTVAPAKAATKSLQRHHDAIEAQLERYRSMRDFDITAEPSGKQNAKITPDNQHPFVIQKHAASHLHYDFRLGWNGVLKSWACAKGPSYYPGDRRLAVQVEDHPIEYGGFEGIIPAGQYGGGTVMLWDQGTWAPQPGHTDVDAGLRDGSLKFTLKGTKMKGNWALVRMKGKAANEAKPNWLLIKEHDGLEHKEDDRPIIEEAPNSVVTGRSLDEIATAKDHVWNSKDPAKADATPLGAKTARAVKVMAAELAGDLVDAPSESLPKFVAPQLATQATAPPKNGGWLNEIKLDGYRIQARLQGGKVHLLTRTGIDWTHRMKPIATAVANLPAEAALLDGEVVVLRDDGTTSFADLQASFQDGASASLTYFVFDLLHLDGHNLKPLSLVKRKAILADLLKDSSNNIRLCEHLESDSGAVFRRACELHVEGIISKRSDAPYTSGRSTSWLKLKCIHEQEFVVAGFTLPGKGHSGMHGIGSLLLGYYDESKKLIYAGRTGTGFTHHTHNKIRTQLEKLRQTVNPFHNPPPEARNGAIWVRPLLVAQVRFANWTADNLLRQASFQGLREDKPAKEVRREQATPQPRTARKSASHSVPTPIAAKLVQTAQAAPVRLTHPDKIFDAESGLTKQQLADYYWAIAPYMLPQIAGRPLSLVRCPDGSAKPCFFQKHTSGTLPAGIESIEVPDKKTGKPEPYITLSTPEALAGLAQMGVLEVHSWGSCNEDLEHPDRIVIDLDPDAAIAWPPLAHAAEEVRKRLKKLGLKSFLKATGGKGLHVVVPIEPLYEWSTIKDFAHNFVLDLEKSKPQLYLTKMTKSARANKIYLDYLRNERGSTSVAAFSPRARPGIPVSLPLSWSDLKLSERPLFHVRDYTVWKSRLGHDPWKQLPSVHQTLP